jgi:hypothetical protein
MPIRFNTDRSLFEAYPTARKDVDVEPRDIEPTALARTLVTSGKIDQAVSLCAYMLGRRDAVAWGCRSLRGLIGNAPNWSSSALQAAELWVADTTELRQDAARDAGAAGSDNEPTTWMARAAGWAGGTLGPQFPVPVPPHLTAVGVRIGLILALYKLKPAERLERGRSCVEDAIRIAEGGRQP